MSVGLGRTGFGHSGCVPIFRVPIFRVGYSGLAAASDAEALVALARRAEIY
jgi:hypothetical protein